MDELRKALFAFLNTQPGPVIAVEDGRVVYTNPAAACLAPDILEADARELFGEELATPGAVTEGVFRGEPAQGTDLGGLRLITIHSQRLPLMEDRSFVNALVDQIHSALSIGLYRLQDVTERVREAGDLKSIRDLASMDRNLCQVLRLARNLGRVYGEEDMQPKMSLLDLEELVRDLLASVSFLTKKRGVPLELTSNGPVELYGDGRLLEIMLMELLSNAIKFSRAGGAVTVSLGVSGGSAFIKVSDNGGGEDRLRLDALRERFGQSAKAMDPDAGVGLGLHAARRIAALHGGAIISQTLPGGAGTTFTAALPIVKPDGTYLSEPDENACTAFDILIEISDVADDSAYESRDIL